MPRIKSNDDRAESDGRTAATTPRAPTCPRCPANQQQL